MAAKRIMVVDDEPDILESVSAALEKEGYDVVTAGDGRECLRKLERGKKPDLILMDFFMPGMSGREAIERIRRDPKFGGVKIVYMTVAEFRERGLQSIRDLGVKCCINKPISVEDLIKKVGSSLRK